MNNLIYYILTILLSDLFLLSSFHQEDNTTPEEVYDYTLKHYGNDYANDIDHNFNNLSIRKLKSELRMISVVSLTKQQLGIVILSNLSQPLAASGTNIQDQNSQPANITYQKYIFADGGLPSENGHSIAHFYGYHILHTNPSYIAHALLQWLSKNLDQTVHSLAFTHSICPAWHYLLTTIYPQINIQLGEQNCDPHTLSWPLEPNLMHYLNQQIIQLEKPLQVTQKILTQFDNTPQKEITQLQEENMIKKILLVETQTKTSKQSEKIKRLHQQITLLKNQVSNSNFNTSTNNQQRQTSSPELLKTLTSHTDWVNSVAFSKDFRYLVSAGNDKTIHLYEATNYTLLKIFNHTDWVNKVDFSQDSERLIASSYQTVNIYSTRNYRLIETIEDDITRVGFSLAHSPNIEKIALKSMNNTVEIYCNTCLSPSIILKNHTDTINSILFSPAGNVFATASKDKTINIYDTTDYQLLRTLQDHTDDVMSIAFSPNGKLFASAGKDKTILLYDATTYQVIKTLKGHTDVVTSLSFSFDSKRLVSGSYDKEVKVWCLNDFSCEIILDDMVF